MALRLKGHERAVAARVARSEPFTVDLPVDGEPVRFDGLRCPVGWAAMGRTEDVQLTIEHAQSRRRQSSSGGSSPDQPRVPRMPRPDGSVKVDGQALDRRIGQVATEFLVERAEHVHDGLRRLAADPDEHEPDTRV